MESCWIFEPVRVEFHLDGGYTKILLERLWGMTDAEIDWDIPTNSIPPDLRTIGSRFLLSRSSRDPNQHDRFEEIRAAYPDLRIVRLASLTSDRWGLLQ